MQAWRRTTPQEQSGKARFDLFDVVSHYDEAAELVEDPEERLLIAQLNLKAAIKGKNSMGTQNFQLLPSLSETDCPLRDTAYEMASKVAAQGIAMLPADYWRSQHKLAFHLFLGTHRTPPHLIR